MEKIIYEQAIARFATQAAYITGQGFTPPVTQAWFEKQYDQALADKDNESVPFDVPALFYEFSPTKYVSNNKFRQNASGQLTLHIVQSKMADGREGSESHATFKNMLLYYDVIVNLLNGYKLPCGARPMLSGGQRDHENRGLMIEKAIFNWEALRRRPAGIP